VSEPACLFVYDATGRCSTVAFCAPERVRAFVEHETRPDDVHVSASWPDGTRAQAHRAQVAGAWVLGSRSPR
jgi:hypothetical protein